MKRFDIKGMMVFPNPITKTKLLKEKELLVVKECFCQKGHNLISDRAIFDGFPGIMLRLKKGKNSGLVALNPIYGYKSRISLDINLKRDETWKICCPVCNEPLPVYSSCNHCEGDLTALFLDKKGDFFNCILVCNRIGCLNAEIKFNNEIIYYPGETVLK